VSGKRYKIVVCRGPECGDRLGSSAIHARFVEGIRARGLEGRCELAWQSCFGRCRQGPNVLLRAIQPNETRFLLAMAPLAPGQGGAFYSGVTPADTARILDEHVVLGRVVRELIVRPEAARPEAARPDPGAPAGDPSPPAADPSPSPSPSPFPSPSTTPKK
jgi:(2Fe-2S) ferredoxin